MMFLGWFLMIYGAFILVGFILQFPFLYTNPKSKAFIKVLGKTGFSILLITIGVLCLAGGLFIIS